MAEIYGNPLRTPPEVHYLGNKRDQQTFVNGPKNTYLMEPFFGTNKESTEIADTESARNKLAEVYCDALIDWIR